MSRTSVSGASSAVPLRGLYAVTPDDMMLPRLLALVKAALDGGVRLLQYRNTLASPELRRVQAKALLSVCRVAGAKLIIDEDVWLAIEIGADGAHVSHHTAPGHSLATAREALGTHRLLGVSCRNDLSIAAKAAEAGADYLAFGAMFATSSQARAATAPLSLLATAKRKFKLPVCAIGGVNLHNAPEAIDAGADMVAVLNGLFDVMNISRQAKLFQSLFKS